METASINLPRFFFCVSSSRFPAFYAGIKIPAEQFVLTSLYRDGKLYYPQAQYEPFHDYSTFFDLHESLAWLYAFNSPANPFHRDRALRRRAQQLALSHLMECLRYIATTLDAEGPEILETPLGHWNLWPVCGAFRLCASGDPRDLARYEKWANVQLMPDAFTSHARHVSDMSPVDDVRDSGVDLGYNGQAKNWMAPLFAALGPDSLVGGFARRQYRLASFATLEEPDGSLSSLQHMNSHSTQAIPYEQWATHKHLAYAVKLPDAVPFAVPRAMHLRSQADGGRSAPSSNRWRNSTPLAPVPRRATSQPLHRRPAGRCLVGPAWYTVVTDMLDMPCEMRQRRLSHRIMHREQIMRKQAVWIVLVGAAMVAGWWGAGTAIGQNEREVEQQIRQLRQQVQELVEAGRDDEAQAR